MKKYILTGVLSFLAPIILAVSGVLIYNASAQNKLSLCVGDRTIFGEAEKDAPTNDTELTAKILELTLEIDKLNADITNLNSKLNEKLQQIAELNNSNEDKSAEIERINGEIETIQSELDSLNSQLDEKIEEITTLETDYSTLLEENNTLTGLLESAQAEIRQLKADLSVYQESCVMVTYSVNGRDSLSVQAKGSSINYDTSKLNDFLGWSIDGMNLVEESYIITSDVKLIAIFKTDTLSLSFNTNDKISYYGAPNTKILESDEYYVNEYFVFDYNEYFSEDLTSIVISNIVYEDPIIGSKYPEYYPGGIINDMMDWECTLEHNITRCTGKYINVDSDRHCLWTIDESDNSIKLFILTQEDNQYSCTLKSCDISFIYN